MATRRNSLDQPNATKAPRSAGNTTVTQPIVTARAKPKRTGLGLK